MRIPLHQEPEDVSPESAAKRLRLYDQAMQANPSGFRVSRMGKNGIRHNTARNRRRLGLETIATHKDGTKHVIQLNPPERYWPPRSGLELKLNGLMIVAKHGERAGGLSQFLKGWFKRG